MSAHLYMDQLGLPRDLAQIANRANLTPLTILLTPIPRLAELLRVKVPVVQTLVKRVSRAVAPPTRTVEEVHQQEEGFVSGEQEERQEADEQQHGEAREQEEQNDPGAIASSSRYPPSQLTKTDKYRGRWISTGDDGMDKALGGGLRRGCLYEITGESAAGKSHLALTLALSSQLPSLTSSPGGSLILTSERELSTDRLVQLGKSLLMTHEPDYLETEQGGRVRALLDNVLTNRVGDVDALEHALNYAVPAVLEARLRGLDGRMGSNGSSTGPRNGSGAGSGFGPRTGSNQTTTSTTSENVRSMSNPSVYASTSTSNSSRRQTRNDNALPIRLIILDSITALFRGGTSSADDKPTTLSSLSLTERSKHLCIVSDALKSLAVTYDLAIVVINQVSDVFTRIGPSPASPPTSSFNQTQAFVGSSSHHAHDGQEDPPMLYASQARWFSGQSNTLMKEASLGIVWANAVNVRIMLSRTGRRRLLHQSDLRPSKRRKPGDSPSPAPEVGAASASAADPTTIGVEVDDVKPTLIRRMHVVFSPFSPASTVDYAITPSGVHSLAGSYKIIDVTEVTRKKKAMEVKMLREDEDLGFRMGVESSTNAQSGSGPAHGPVLGTGMGPGEDDNGSDNGDAGNEEWDVFDDFGELPEEFWKGNYGLDDQGRVVMPSADADLALVDQGEAGQVDVMQGHGEGDEIGQGEMCGSIPGPGPITEQSEGIATHGP